MSNVLITGCSSGFGLLTAQTFARRCHQVFAAVRNVSAATEIRSARDAETLPISILEMDVRDSASIHAAVSAALDGGPIDVLVNNAGYALAGPIEELDQDELLAQFDTNVFGVMRMVQAVAPGMRERHSGTIVNVSSGGVYRVPPFGGAYVASKAAVGALSEALHHELRPFGVRVILVEPGPFATKFAANMRLARTATPDSPYHEAFQQFVARLRELVGTASDPQQVADAICEAVAADTPAFRHLVAAGGAARVGSLERLAEACHSSDVVSMADALHQVLERAPSWVA